MLTLRVTANHVVLHCVMQHVWWVKCFYFISFFMGVLWLFLGVLSAGAPASPSLAPPMPKGFLGWASGAERIERAELNLQNGALRSKGNMTATLPLHSAPLTCSAKKCLMLTESAFIWPKSTVKANLKSFRIIIPVFSVTWSFRNHSDMLICCSKTFLLLSMLKAVVQLNIFVETVINVFLYFFDE